MRKTKIVCTLGPATESKEMLEKLIKAGMNIARLNFSHGEYKEFSSIIKHIRSISKKLGINVAIMQDLQGFKIRIGKMKEEKRMLKNNEKVIFTVDGNFKEGEIPVDYKGFSKDVKIGDRVFVVDGRVELKVVKKMGKKVELKVINGGEISSRKGMNIPDTNVSNSPITEKDIKDLQFGLKQGVDYVAISFIRNKKDILELREYLKKFKKPKTKIITKVETRESIEKLEEVMEESDGVMIARGDLAVEISLEKMPLVQKRITSLANEYGKPVITATQMLFSMEKSPVPTRAEVSDVANAILEGTDCIMLSGETSIGKYPIEAVKIMNKISLEVEKGVEKSFHCELHEKCRHETPSRIIGCNGTMLAEEIDAKCIIVFTVSGFTALQVARFHSHIPVVVFTLTEKVKKELAFTYGINNVYILKNLEKKSSVAIKMLKKDKQIKKGDSVVIISVGKEQKDGVMDDIRIFTLK